MSSTLVTGGMFMRDGIAAGCEGVCVCGWEQFFVSYYSCIRSADCLYVGLKALKRSRGLAGGAGSVRELLLARYLFWRLG